MRGWTNGKWTWRIRGKVLQVKLGRGGDWKKSAYNELKRDPVLYLEAHQPNLCELFGTSLADAIT